MNLAPSVQETYMIYLQDITPYISTCMDFLTNEGMIQGVGKAIVLNNYKKDLM